ncbi:methionine synthase [Nocardioides insulae]|uniref:methionine synthase n=1 Tax=Nocardioides insulae TaxID=394734 RepID=UPI0004281DB0|nr:methionine synthase [Nocardioides insulae]
MRATGIGSLPGEEYAEATRMVLGELGESPGMPHLPELPARGATASMTGRALAVLADLDADLQPAGWRLTGSSGAPGVDHRRARSLLAQDLDAVEELTHDSGRFDPAGGFKIQLAGPWTLAATVERPRGDKILADHGARRELAQALAEGLRDHVRDVRRRVGAERLVVQLDEPALAAVHAGRVPTASGYGRHRSVDRPELTETLGWVLEAITAEDAEPWVHSCAPQTPWELVRTAGAVGLAADLGVLSAADHDQFAEAIEAGQTVALGVVPSLDPAPDAVPTDKAAVERALRWLDMLGLDPEEHGERLVLTPTCGLAGASAAWAGRAMTLTRQAATAF